MKKIWKSIVAVFACSSLMVSMPVSAAEDGNAQKLKEGSFAFFQDAGADEALDALNNSQYAELTIKGDADDATSFDNMLKSFQWIRRCNELREMNGLEPLLVNNEMMAMAQADANYSDTVIGHAQQFAVGENCAWNWGKTDPFIQWYDEEKEIYDQMETPGWTSETGHYLNIIEPGYKTTGFAINTRGTKYPCTYVQVFSYSDDGITVDEYEKIVMDYYNSITSNETPDSEDDTDNSGSDDNNGSGDNSGSDDNNGSGDNSGSDDNNGSGDNSGSDDNNGSGDNSG
ncbi:MAG: hypothetical protein HFH82_04655, partial [Lachnospiraceae bacterium]|nr:hypothetical protein [Lachnospiraceae bacterium]